MSADAPGAPVPGAPTAPRAEPARPSCSSLQLLSTVLTAGLTGRTAILLQKTKQQPTVWVSLLTQDSLSHLSLGPHDGVQGDEQTGHLKTGDRDNHAHQLDRKSGDKT